MKSRVAQAETIQTSCIISRVINILGTLVICHRKEKLEAFDWYNFAYNSCSGGYCCKLVITKEKAFYQKTKKNKLNFTSAKWNIGLQGNFYFLKKVKIRIILSYLCCIFFALEGLISKIKLKYSEHLIDFK